MDKLPLFRLDGSQNGEIELNSSLFGVRVNEQLLRDVLVAYAGNQRRGTHDTKERKEVSGGGKKPWKQKGTGRARQGSIRSPQWRGGGKVFGPTPRDYDTHLPQEMRRQALISALSLRNQEKQLVILDTLSLNQPKTKELASAIRTLGLSQVRSLCVVAGMGENLKRASRNMKEIFSIKPAQDVNAYHILRRKQLVIERSALSLLEKRLLGVSNVNAEKEAVMT